MTERVGDPDIELTTRTRTTPSTDGRVSVDEVALAVCRQGADRFSPPLGGVSSSQCDRDGGRGRGSPRASHCTLDRPANTAECDAQPGAPRAGGGVSGDLDLTRTRGKGETSRTDGNRTAQRVASPASGPTQRSMSASDFISKTL
jgi:hypothetical protein